MASHRRRFLIDRKSQLTRLRCDNGIADQWCEVSACSRLPDASDGWCHHNHLVPPPILAGGHGVAHGADAGDQSTTAATADQMIGSTPIAAH